MQCCAFAFWKAEKGYLEGVVAPKKGKEEAHALGVGVCAGGSLEGLLKPAALTIGQAWDSRLISGGVKYSSRH